jgi:chromosome segregation ATPase
VLCFHKFFDKARRYADRAFNPGAFRDRMSSGRFDQLLAQVQGRIETLENQAREFSSMSTLDQKRQTVARSRRDFATMQNNLTEMERLIQTMPLRDRDFFAQDLGSCRESINQLKDTFQALEVELERLIKEEEDRIAAGGLDADLVESNRQKIGGVMDSINLAMKTNQDTLRTQEHTMGTLQDDRARLGNINGNLDVIDNEADKGFARAGRMLRRALLNGVVTWTINFLLLCILGVCLAWKFGAFDGPKPTATTDPKPPDD